MKEVSGETNMLLVVALLVAVLAAFFYTVIWPIIDESASSTSRCDFAICNNRPNSDGTTVSCKNDDGDTITCPWKG